MEWFCIFLVCLAIPARYTFPLYKVSDYLVVELILLRLVFKLSQGCSLAALVSWLLYPCYQDMTLLQWSLLNATCLQ